jgi:hypothetical protein
MELPESSKGKLTVRDLFVMKEATELSTIRVSGD